MQRDPKAKPPCTTIPSSGAIVTSKLSYIINNQSKNKAINVQEKDMRSSDKYYNAYDVFQKIKENVFIPNELT